MHARCLGGQQEEKRPYKTMVVTSREQAAFLSGWPNLCHALTADSGECPIGSDTLPQPIALPRGASCFPRAGHSRPLALVCPDHPLTQTIQSYRRLLVCTPGAPNSPPPIAKCSDSILDNETNCALQCTRAYSTFSRMGVTCGRASPSIHLPFTSHLDPAH